MKGKDLMVMIGGVIYGFGTDCSINHTTDTSEVTTTKYKRRTSAGKFKEFESDVNSVTIDSSYVVSESIEDYKALRDKQLAGEPVEVSFLNVTDSTNMTGTKGSTGTIEAADKGIKESGMALITSMQLQAPVEGECTFSINLQGTGVWTTEIVGV